MTSKIDRFFNPKDGTYANVPIIPVHAEKFRGKRPFNTNVLISNWYEDRFKFKESPHRSRSFYKIEYPAHVGSVPDTVLRRKVFSSHEERPERMLVDHHDIDDKKQLISSYDEHYTRRGPYGEFQEASLRKWAIQDRHWLPERSDHPLESTPTNWGLGERKRAESQCIRRQRLAPEISEYTDRYVPHRPDVYSSAKRPGIPRIYSTTVDRSASDCTYRPTKKPDIAEIDFACSSRRNGHLPRAYFCLGSIQNEIEQRMKRKLPHLVQSTELIQPSNEQSIHCE